MPSWQYSDTKLGNILKTSTGNFESVINRDYEAIVTIKNFEQRSRGFYTCQSVEVTQIIEETILITDSKFYIFPGNIS